MTPKEKAQELLDKMNVTHYLKLGGKNKNSKGLPVSMHRTQVKQCALKAVDEIMNELSEMNYGLQYLNRMAHWEEVKEEIENLQTK